MELNYIKNIIGFQYVSVIQLRPQKWFLFVSQEIISNFSVIQKISPGLADTQFFE